MCPTTVAEFNFSLTLLCVSWIKIFIELYSHHKHENDVGDHDYDYDHEAFLGDEAEEFDHLTPEESQHRLATIVDKIDKVREDSYHSYVTNFLVKLPTNVTLIFDSNVIMSSLIGKYCGIQSRIPSCRPNGS